MSNSKEKRIIKFLPNRVNVITGESGTGKSSIMTIIDYCLLGSETKLVEEVINENVEWYGLKFSINEHIYFIARKKLVNQLPSDEVHFSSTGVIPDYPTVSISISDLRKIIENEFGINSNLVIPYGGKKIQAGSKVSYRYFLLFNTQSSSIILNPNVFFDFDLYDGEKYREALDRIFDLSIGVDTVDNVLIRDKINQLDKEVNKLEKRKKLTEKEVSEYGNRIIELVRAAQEYDLIEKKLFTPDEAAQKLRDLISDFKEDKISTDLSDLEDLYNRRREIGRKIRNLKSFETEYNKYRETIKADTDSLQPIDFISENYGELIPIPEVKSFIGGLREELGRIKETIAKRKPFATDVSKEINELEKELANLNSQIQNYPVQTKNFESSIGKFMFIGELRAKLSFYSREFENNDYDNFISELQSESEELSKKLQDNDERRSILYELLRERIQNYVTSSNAIGNYKNFKAYFNQRKKVLQLREPNSSHPSTIGSSSNHMFLHLFLFLGLHEHFIQEKIRFVPQFLILDQLSQPYYESARKLGQKEISDNSDKAKLTEAFQMLNNFVRFVTSDLTNSFQIILLEHAPKEYWEANSMEYFHLVEEFRDGNALVIN